MGIQVTNTSLKKNHKYILNNTTTIKPTIKLNIIIHTSQITKHFSVGIILH